MPENKVHNTAKVRRGLEAMAEIAAAAINSGFARDMLRGWKREREREFNLAMRYIDQQSERKRKPAAPRQPPPPPLAERLTPTIFAENRPD